MEGITPFCESEKHDFSLYLGDCRKITQVMRNRFDMVFADPPVFSLKLGDRKRNGHVKAYPDNKNPVEVICKCASQHGCGILGIKFGNQPLDPFPCP